MFHVKHSFASERIEAPCSLFRSPRRSTVVEYAHAFCEGTYRHRRTLAFRAGRRGCMPRLRTARFRMPRTVCPAAHGGSAGRRSLPRPSLLFLSIPLAHGFARGAASVPRLDMARLQLAKSCAPPRGPAPGALFHVKHLFLYRRTQWQVFHVKHFEMPRARFQRKASDASSARMRR